MWCAFILPRCVVKPVVVRVWRVDRIDEKISVWGVLLRVVGATEVLIDEGEGASAL
jgi:hypothetical protein